jgi:hypothetical protein
MCNRFRGASIRGFLLGSVWSAAVPKAHVATLAEGTVVNW